jgi:hypothetical protein
MDLGFYLAATIDQSMMVLRTRCLQLCVAIALAWRATSFHIHSCTVKVRGAPALAGRWTPARSRLFDDEVKTQEQLEKLEEVWAVREKTIRNTLKSLALFKLEEGDIEEKKGASSGGEKTKEAVVTSAVVVVIGAAVLRLGGRAALVSLLGLDFVAELGLGDQIDQVVVYAQQVSPMPNQTSRHGSSYYQQQRDDIKGCQTQLSLDKRLLSCA